MANVTRNEVTELLENLITLTNFNANKLLGRNIADVLHIVKVVGGSMHMLVQSWIKKRKKKKKKRRTVFILYVYTGTSGILFIKSGFPARSPSTYLIDRPAECI